MDKVITWAPLKDFPGYEISTLGDLRSLPRIGPGRWGPKKWGGVYLKSSLCTQTGYLKVRLCGRTRAVHRLVALTFLPTNQGKNVVNHKNGIKTDNCVDNLEWTSYSGNSLHAYRVLEIKNPMAGKTGARHHGSQAVEGVSTSSGRVVIRFDSQMDARKAGYSNQCISLCLNGKNKTHKGLVWRRSTK